MTKQIIERKTYESRAQEYSLDPKKVFEVVADLSAYIRMERGKQERAWTTNFTSLHFTGRRRSLVIGAEALEPNRQILTSVDLAELVLSGNGRKLDFKVHPVERLVVDPSDLSYIAEKYQIK